MRYKLVETPPYTGKKLIANDTCRLCCCADYNNSNKCNTNKRGNLANMLGDCTEDVPLQHYEEINLIIPINIKVL